MHAVLSCVKRLDGPSFPPESLRADGLCRDLGGRHGSPALSLEIELFNDVHRTRKQQRVYDAASQEDSPQIYVTVRRA